MVEPLKNSFKILSSCNQIGHIPWSYGNQLLKHLNSNKLIIKSDLIDFDSKTGLRKNQNLYIVDWLIQTTDLVKNNIILKINLFLFY